MSGYVFKRDVVTKKIRGNVECSFCHSKFEVIEDTNADVILDKINMVSGVNESVSLVAIAKCNVCNFKIKYYGTMKL